MFDKKAYMKNYQEENKEKILERHKIYYEKNKEEILKNHKKYRDEHKEDHKKYRIKHKEHLKKYNKKYNEEHKEKLKKYMGRWYEQYRVNILNIISNDNPHCVRCGCDDIRLLEINHKNGGGSKELQGGKLSSKFSRDILKGIRKTDDLELLCKVCNSWHYLELKYGKLPYKVSYNKENKNHET